MNHGSQLSVKFSLLVVLFNLIMSGDMPADGCELLLSTDIGGVTKTCESFQTVSASQESLVTARSHQAWPRLHFACILQL